MNSQEKFVINYLEEKNGFTLSSEIINTLTRNFPKISNDYARKIISNLNKENKISSSKPITFLNNSYAYAKRGTNANYNNLKELIKTEKPKLYRAICLIKRQKGIITYNELARVTGGVTSQLGNNLEIKQIINDLEYFKICHQKMYKNICFFIGKDLNILDSDLDEKILELEKRNKILVHLLSWLKSTDIINPDDIVTFAGKDNNYNGIENGKLIWDSFFFTNMVGISNYKSGKKKTIGVIDLNYKTAYDVIDVNGFMDRVNIFINSTKNAKRNVFPIIFANEITNSAYNLIKENNYMCINIKTILGSNFEKIVSNYINIIKREENKKNIDAKEIEHTLKLIGDNSNYGNMKGMLFEYMMGEVFNKIYEKSANIYHSEKIKKREIDYNIETKSEYIFVELKAYNKDVEIKLGDENQKYTVNWAYKGSFKEFKEKYDKSPRRECKFCYITTSKFEEKAITVLEKLNKGRLKATKLDCYYDRGKLIKLLKNYECNKEIKIINKYF